MQYKDYYAVLGVKRDATQKEIKQAYRRLARKYHPDVSRETGAEAHFKEVGEAYDVLKDAEKRAAYDTLGANWRTGQDFEPPPGWDNNFEFSGHSHGVDAATFSEFFENLFAGGHASDRPRATAGYQQARSEDHHAKILIDLEDSFRGVTRVFNLQRPVLTPTGHVRTQSHSLKVSIPVGVKAGQRIRLAGQGGPGTANAPAGDLYLEVAFKSNKLYEVSGRDLTMELPVAPWEAALGCQLTVPTPGGPVDVRVPAGSSGGRKLRLRGRGIPGKPAGDLYLVLRIALPPADTTEARALYKKMAHTFRFNPRAALAA